METRFFEMVLGGHPDKVCDIIAENIKKVVIGKSAVEVVWFNNKIIVGGEVGIIPDNNLIRKIIKKTLKELDYNEKVNVEILLQQQSLEIANVVKNDNAGDNGVFYAGYHIIWTPIINKIKLLAKDITKLAPTFNYRTDGKFIALINEAGVVEEFVINIASRPEMDKKGFASKLDLLLLKYFNITKLTTIKINPQGDWHKCGGFADSGLTGRKLACDNSMGLYHQGGGAFFGKDVSKADYSVPLYLQHLAEQRVYAENLTETELKAYTIFGDRKVKIFDEKGVLVKRVHFDFIQSFALADGMDWTGL